MIYSKTFDEADYDLMTEHIHVDNIIAILRDTDNGLAHPHRRWEYGLAIRALLANKAKTVLDIGGGGTVFAPAASWLGMEVIQVDPEPYIKRVLAHAKVIDCPLAYIQKDFMDYNSRREFDAVTAISTIEHVLDDGLFFDKMLTFIKPGGLLFITTDFHPSGEALAYPYHLRTYNIESLEALYVRASKEFAWFGDTCDYAYRGEDVNNYTFASMVLKKNE